jgi:hypothetical protein
MGTCARGGDPVTGHHMLRDRAKRAAARRVASCESGVQRGEYPGEGSEGRFVPRPAGGEDRLVDAYVAELVEVAA